MDLLLKNLSWTNNEEIEADVRISKGLITEIGNNLSPKKKENVFDFKNHFLYPGLINSHDHLEMNLYAKLGNPPYNNYVGWANDIYKPYESPILEIEKVNIKDRLLWGGIKNLISGVTTVVHHNPWHRLLGRSEFPVKVLKKISWAHSLSFGKNIQKSYSKKNNIPFVIHAGEGLDELAFSEIAKLNGLGLLQKNTVLIHAIALKEQDIQKLSDQKVSIVWCPASNLYMFNQTAQVQNLKTKLKIALGSDSTLTGSPTLLEEIKIAADTGLATSGEIFKMVTSIPAEIFNLPNPSFNYLEPADLFITPIRHKNYFENLIHTDPADIALVLIDGKPKLIDAGVANGLKSLKYKVKVHGVLKHIDIDVTTLRKRIEKKVGSSILEKNPLWNLIQS